MGSATKLATMSDSWTKPSHSLASPKGGASRMPAKVEDWKT